MEEFLIDLKDVALGYEHKTVLADVSFTLYPRDFLILQGPNGGGKTTLLRLLAGLAKAECGHVVRREGLRLGYLPQYRRIDRQFPITVLEVVRSGLAGQKPLFRRFGREATQRAQSVMRELGLESLANRPIDALSGGQWQRTLLGRALVGRPDLLLLDEPDTHLDLAHKQQLYATLHAQRSRMAIVMVSHDETLPARFPDCRCLLVGGGQVHEKP